MKTIKVRRKVLREIEKKAKADYPLEVIGYLTGDKEQVSGVLWPRQLQDKDSCSIYKGEYARLSREYKIIGSVHSHPDMNWPVPSGFDHGDDCDKICFSIISVFEVGKEGSKKLRTNIVFFKPLEELEVKETGR